MSKHSLPPKRKLKIENYYCELGIIALDLPLNCPSVLWRLLQTMENQTCPKCSNQLNPPLASGRRVCSKCGWTNQPRNNQSSEITSPNSLNNIVATLTSKAKLSIVTSKGILDSLLKKVPSNMTLPIQIFGGVISGGIVLLGIFHAYSSLVSQHSLAGVSQHSLTGVSQHSLTGELTIADGAYMSEYNLGMTECGGYEGYSDINLGTQVIVKDAAGKIIASGELGRGKNTGISCRFPISVRGIPDSDFYQIEIGTGNRGVMSYSKDELEDKNWEIVLSLSS